MKIKLDENLPLLLSATLQSLGHDVHTTQQEGLTGKSDDQVWQFTQKEGRFLITQDLDFSDIRQFIPRTHCGILLVRLHSPSRRNLTDRVTRLFQRENVEEWAGCFVVVSDRKVRILRPSQR